LILASLILGNFLFRHKFSTILIHCLHEILYESKYDVQWR
jgi:hypothetical protein